MPWVGCVDDRVVDAVADLVEGDRHVHEPGVAEASRVFGDSKRAGDAADVGASARR